MREIFNHFVDEGKKLGRGGPTITPPPGDFLPILTPSFDPRIVLMFDTCSPQLSPFANLLDAGPVKRNP